MFALCATEEEKTLCLLRRKRSDKSLMYNLRWMVHSIQFTTLLANTVEFLRPIKIFFFKSENFT